MNTVQNGLKFLKNMEGVSRSDWVLVHDAVRPGILHDDIVKLINCANQNQRGAVLGKKVVDTLKLTEDNTIINSTISRRHIWRAFTPQVFMLDQLIRGIETSLKDDTDITDESMAMEKIGIHADMVEGHPGNMKITIAEDLELMELFLSEFS